MEFKTVLLRKAIKNCFCKLCGKSITKDTEDIIVFETCRGRLGTIHLCLPCIDNINEVINREE